MVASSAIREQMKGEINNNPELSARQAYDNVVQNIDRRLRDNVPSFESARSALDRERRKHIPEIPLDIANVQIDGRWRRTTDGRRFLSKIDNAWGYAVFATDEALECLGECNDVFMDGTFKSVPRPYAQLLTVHGFYRDRVIPLVFVLMHDRQIGTYRQVFSHIKRKFNRLTGNQLQPTNIITDFETGLITAAETEFPQARMYGCFFHFCRSLWRKCQTEGLTRAYERGNRLKKFIRKIMAIAYLPVAVVRQNYRVLLQERGTLALLRRYGEGLTNFVNYFTRNYMNGQFQPAFWNVYLRDMDTRTNNHVECKLKYIFSSPELKAQVSFSDHLSSVVCLSVCLSVHLSVNFSHFHLFLQNHWANFNQT